MPDEEPVVEETEIVPDFDFDIEDEEDEAEPEDPRLSMTAAEISKLYRGDLQAWRLLFFPEYDGLPTSAIVTYYNPFKPPTRRPRIRRVSPIQELAPWGNSGETDDLRGIADGYAQGVIHPSCFRFAVKEVVISRRGRPDRTIQKKTMEAVPVDEYIDWCDGLNYFRNGGQSSWGIGLGLNPLLF